MQKIIYILFSLAILISSPFAEETFVSLKKSKVNVRYGPSFDSDIKYVYKKINLPLKEIDKKDPCLRCFYQEETISDDILSCEYEGILGTIAGIIGTMQANEILKKILNIGQNLNGFVLILDLLNLNFRKVKLNKRKKCKCN